MLALQFYLRHANSAVILEQPSWVKLARLCLYSPFLFSWRGSVLPGWEQNSGCWKTGRDPFRMLQSFSTEWKQIWLCNRVKSVAVWFHTETLAILHPIPCSGMDWELQNTTPPPLSVTFVVFVWSLSKFLSWLHLVLLGRLKVRYKKCWECAFSHWLIAWLTNFGTDCVFKTTQKVWFV